MTSSSREGRDSFGHVREGGAGMGQSARPGDQQMMDDMGSEVFNLKLAVQEYEDRLAKLYQTEDRSMWRGSATLLNDLEAADREVDRLEDTVADLQWKLDAARGGRVSGNAGMDVRERSNTMTSLDTQEELDHNRAYMAELQAQMAELEEDNRVLMEAAGWERCELSEGEEEDDMLVPTGKSRRLRSIDALSDKIKELHGLVALSEEKEEAATSAAEAAVAGRDDAVAKIEELQAAVERYKQDKAAAEECVDALRSEMERRLGDRRAGDEAAEALAANEKVAVAAETRAAGVNTEPCALAGGVELPEAVRDRLAQLEADVQLWREACDAANDELREEKNLGGETARRLAEKEASVRELTARLSEKFTGAPAGRSAERGQRHGQLSCELSPPAEAEQDSQDGSCCSRDSPSESTSTLADASWKAVGVSPETQAGRGRVHETSLSSAEQVTPTVTAAASASAVRAGDGWVTRQVRGARHHDATATAAADIVAGCETEEGSGADSGGVTSGADASEGSSMLTSSASEAGWVGNGGRRGGGGQDEPSTAECSTETLGGDAEVSFGVESAEEMGEGEGEEDVAAVLVPEVDETGHLAQRRGQRQDRQQQQQHHGNQFISSVCVSAATEVHAQTSPALEQGVKRTASSATGARLVRNGGSSAAAAAAEEHPMRSGLTRVPVGLSTVAVDDRAAVLRAEAAAHRAEVSAQRAECSAENARADRLAAELAAAEAGGTAAAQRAALSVENCRADRLAAELAAVKATSTAAAGVTAAVMAPSHGSFVGVEQQASNRLRREPSARPPRIPAADADSKAEAAAAAAAEMAVPLAVAPVHTSNEEYAFSTTTSESASSERRDGQEEDGDRRARRAARLAKRASVAARLEMLSAAAARERSAGSFSSSAEDLIRRTAQRGSHAASPGARWVGRQSFAGCEADASSLASDEGFRRRDGRERGPSVRQYGDDKSKEDGENGDLSRVAAAVAAVAAQNGFISVGGGNDGGRMASGQTSAAGDYWQQPVLDAAEAASATGGNQSPLSSPSSSVMSKPSSLTGSEKYSPGRRAAAAAVASGRTAAVGGTRAPRGGRPGAQSGLRATECSAHAADANASRTAYRGKQMGDAAVTASTKARRSLEGVGVSGRGGRGGRGGGVIDRPRRDSLGYVGHNEQESNAYGRGFDIRDPFGRGCSGSSPAPAPGPTPGAAFGDGNKVAAGGATTGVRAGSSSSRPQKKLRKKTPAPPALDRRIFRHAHGGPCARSCACAGCPCAGAPSGSSSTHQLRLSRRRPVTAGVR